MKTIMSFPRTLSRCLGLVPLVALALGFLPLTPCAQAVTTTQTFDLGTSPAGTTIAGSGTGTLFTWIAQGSLPVGSILRSVTATAVKIEDNPSGSWASDLGLYIDPTPGTPGGDGLLRIADDNDFGGAVEQMNWNNEGQGDGPMTTTLSAGSQFSDTIDLGTAAVMIGSAYGTATWSGTITVEYDIASLTLSLTDPTDGSSWLSGSTIPASATVIAGTGPFTVEFFVDDISAGTAVTMDPYTLDLVGLSDGTHTVYATVTDSLLATATSATHTILVAPATPTTTTLATSGTPTTYGHSVTFTATVAPTPSGGTVQFYDDGNPIGSPVAVVAGTADYSTSLLAVATHSITAEYSGSGAYLSSSALALSQTVEQALLTVTADNKVRAPGTANPTLTYKITGYQNGENFGSAGITGSPDLSTLADNLSPEGPYAITCTVGDLAATNYSFTAVDGILTVQAGAPPVSNGMVCWFDASSIAVADGAQVDTWNDLSGNGHTATRTSGSPKFALNDIKYDVSSSARPGVHFRSNNGIFTVAGGMFVKEQYVVVRSPNPNWSNGMSFFGRKSDNFLTVRSSSYNTAGGTTGFWQDHHPLTVVKNGYAPAPYPSVVNNNGSQDKNGNFSNGCRFAIDDIMDYMILKIVVDADASPANLAQYPFYEIGRNEGVGSGEFDIAEIIGYDTTLSAGDEAALGAYLENKYGIPAPNYTDQSPQAFFVNFSINGLPTRIDQARREIVVTAVSPVDLSALVPTFTLSDGATCTVGGNPVTSGVTEVNYSPAHYIVTSSDSSKTTDYTVTVNWVVPTGRVNLDIDYSVRGSLVGPAGGSGATWNSTPQSNKSSLLDSGGNVTSVGFTSTNLGGPDEWGSPSLDVLKQGLRNFDTSGGNSQQMVINGLVPARTYDLYIASANLSDQRHNGVWSTTNTTSTPGDHPCGNTGGANGDTWVEGNNYVVFRNVVADGSGHITVDGHSIFVEGFDCRLPMSGFQLVDLSITTLPPAIISGVTASPSIPVGTPSVNLIGTLSDGGAVYAADGEVASVTINGVTHYAAVAGGSGAFSIAFPTASLPLGDYPITYGYVGNGTTLLAAADETSTTLSVIGGSTDFASWAAAQIPAVTGGPFGDSDHDCIPNLVEYALNLNPAASDGAPGTLTDRVISFSKRAEAVANGDVTYEIETSPDLNNPWTTVTPDSNDGTTINYTLPANAGEIYGRLKVTIP